MSNRCPKCGQLAVTRTSKWVSVLAKEATCQCTNAYCSCSFVVVTEAIRIINPGVWPNPLTELPERNRANRNGPLPGQGALDLA
ncbi:ogr/Delta-like zinc finger family protein [Silvimonas sp.]|uniref:ogr/Delta-like zinc finger family protein n=1 Tax=Silvimonas sp. TaxID=2650811 RepID=UPI00386B2E95